MNAKRVTINIKTIIANKIERNKATYVSCRGKSYYEYKGDRIAPEHFAMMLPIEPKKCIIYQ